MLEIRQDHGSQDAERLELEGGLRLGTVGRVTPTQIEVDLAETTLIDQVTVEDLVAMPAAGAFLVALVSAIERRSPHTAQEEALLPIAASGSVVYLRVTPLGTFHPAERGGGAFRRGVSAFPPIGASCHLIDGDRLRAFMSTVAGAVGAGERLVLGRYLADPSAAAVADGNRMFQRHAALLGSTGSGKSCAVALMLERASELSHANLIVFDLHGEYWPLTVASNGREPVARGLRIAGPGDLGQSGEDLLHLPYWLLERDELMSLVRDQGDPYSADHLFRFTEHVHTLKQISLVDEGREDAVATFTVDSPIPYRLDHLVKMLKDDDTEKIPVHPNNRLDPGPYYGRLTGFISRLEARGGDPRYGFIFNPPEETFSYRWLNDIASRLLEAGPGKSGIKIIDLSEVPSAIVPMVAGVLARFVYNVQFWMNPQRRTPVGLVCDEAHLYLPSTENVSPIHRAALQAFEAVAKEGRKYGVALVIVSQRPTDVSRTILSQCNNFVIMRVTNDYDRAIIERLIPQTLTGITDVLPVLDVGEAVLIGDALLLPTPIKIDLPSILPASGTQPYWSLWSSQPSNREAIATGTEALRNQFRPAAKADSA